MTTDKNKLNNGVATVAPSTPDTLNASAANKNITPGVKIASPIANKNESSKYSVSSALGNIASSTATSSSNGVFGSNDKNLADIIYEGKGPINTNYVADKKTNPFSVYDSDTMPILDRIKKADIESGNIYNESGNLKYLPDDGVAADSYFDKRNGANILWDADSGSLSLNGRNIPKNQIYISGNGVPHVSKSVLENIYNYTNTYNDNGNLRNIAGDAVGVTDYFRNKPDAHVTWDSSTGDVMFNGAVIPKDKVYVSGDGRYYVSKSLLDNLYAKSQSDNPYSFDNRINRLNTSRDTINRELKNINNYDEFNYDPMSDPLYKIYAKYYDDAADGEVRNALAQMSGRIGGSLNSAALAAAYQARNNLISQKANIIPTLEKQAYDRWFGEKELRGELVGKALDNINASDENLLAAYGDEFDRDWQRQTTRDNYELDLYKFRNDAEDADLDRASNENMHQKDIDLGYNQIESNEKIAQWDNDVDYAKIEQDAQNVAAQVGLGYAQLDAEQQQFLMDWVLDYDNLELAAQEFKAKYGVGVNLNSSKFAADAKSNASKSSGGIYKSGSSGSSGSSSGNDTTMSTGKTAKVVL